MEQLIATIEPADATNQNVIWSTSNQSVASVVNGIVTAESEGTAVITVTTEDNEHTATCTVKITEQITGAEDHFLMNLNIFPNPFTGAVRFTGAVATHCNTSLRVTNAAGVVVHTQQITGNDEIISLEYLPDGVYFFTVKQDEKTKTVKIIKN